MLLIVKITQKINKHFFNLNIMLIFTLPTPYTDIFDRSKNVSYLM